MENLIILKNNFIYFMVIRMTDANEKARRHLAKGQTMKLGDDEFQIKPITISELTDWVYLLKELAKETKKYTEEELNKAILLEFMNPELIEIAKKLALKTIELSYPEWDEDLRNTFVQSNFVAILNKMLEINKLRSDWDKTLVEKAKALGNVQ